jgi:transcription elongation factor GreB
MSESEQKPSGRNYLTPEGFQKLRGELMQLLNIERPKVVDAVNVAAAMGDRSENAEYIYGKRRLREIDRRIHFLTGRLENHEVIDPSKVSTDKVSFGVWVSVRDDDGQVSHYQIVGPDEIDPALGRITFSSPLGRALLGKAVGDVIEISRPAGVKEFEVISLKLNQPKTQP